MQLEGHTEAGNDITIRANRDYDDMGYRKRYYWAEIEIVMNGHVMDIDDLNDKNKKQVLDQLPDPY